MDVNEARDIIKNERDAPIGRLASAAMTLTMPENANLVTLLDLTECLKRGNELKRHTVIDEIVGLTLYGRTGRPRKPGYAPYEEFITDAEDWLNYLKSQQLI